MPRADKRSSFERFLNLFADVEAGEGPTAALMFANIFLLLASYYILKTVRDALVVGGVQVFGFRGSEVKAYLAAAMSLLLLVVVPAYGLLGSRVSRLRLLEITLIFVIVCLVALGLWGIATGPGTALGVTFYIWIGIVNVFLIAQFWSYANDIYTEKQGQRLFAVIAIGQSLGALVGPTIAGGAKDHTFGLLVVSAFIFAVCLVLYLIVDRREGKAPGAAARESEEPLEREGGFRLVLSNRYLRLIALMILVTNVVNTTGQYILDSAADAYSREKKPASEVLGPEAGARVAASGRGERALSPAEKQKLDEARVPVLQKFYGRFFLLVNLVGLLIQMFLVSRIFKYFGVRAALFVLPVIAFGGYVGIGVLGGLLVIRVAKTAENATDYSLENTVKQALFLPTSRAAKYKAKAAIDTFFVRVGDVVSAAIVGVGINVLAFGARGFAFVNVAVCAVWIILSVGIAREHREMVPDDRGAQQTLGGAG